MIRGDSMICWYICGIDEKSGSVTRRERGKAYDYVHQQVSHRQILVNRLC